MLSSRELKCKCAESSFSPAYTGILNENVVTKSKEICFLNLELKIAKHVVVVRYQSDDDFADNFVFMQEERRENRLCDCVRK